MITATGVGKTIPQLMNITEKGIIGKRLLLKNKAIIIKSAVNLLKLATYNSICVNQLFKSCRLFCTADNVKKYVIKTSATATEKHTMAAILSALRFLGGVTD
jgi:hypothetical protein